MSTFTPGDDLMVYVLLFMSTLYVYKMADRMESMESEMQRIGVQPVRLYPDTE